MIPETSFPNIDKSYWRLDDSEWKTLRKEQWNRIEPMLQSSKSGKGKTAIKQYFLSGKLPDWEKMRDWDSGERHVDLFMFIWLHPSWDEEVLLKLRDAYVSSSLIVPEDVKVGIQNFLRWSTSMACQDYADESDESMKHALTTDGHNELIFKVLLGDLASGRGILNQINVLGEPVKVEYEFPKFSFGRITSMGNWLNIKKMYPINEDMLLQYDLPLDWWYSCSRRDKTALELVSDKDRKPFVERAMFRIHHFDINVEGDTKRSRFVNKIRKILDEGDFIDEIRNIWRNVKEGRIVVKDAWSD